MSLITITPVRDDEIDSLWRIFSAEVNHFSYSASYHLWAKHFYEEFGQFKESSMKIMKESQVIGFWPLFVASRGNVSWIGHFSGRIYEPMVIAKFKEEVDLVLPELISTILQGACEHKIGSIFLQATSNFPIYASSLNLEYSHKSVSELSCDLRLSLEELWLLIRKSYRPLISRELKRLSVSFDYNGNPNSLIEFAELHADVAGRVTRSIQDWEAQGKAIENREGVACYIRDSNEKLIGASFCNLAGRFALYSTGAYDRQMMKDGFALGHLAQWEIIKYLKRETDVTSYILYPGSLNSQVSQKEEQILHFKSGFAREVNVYKVFEIPIR